MILTCQSCSTRYTVDEAAFPPDGRAVRCAKCGHSWHQTRLEAEPQPVPEPEPAQQAEPVAEQPGFGAPATRSYAPAAALPNEPKTQGLQVAAVAAGWIGLIIVVLLIGYSAVRYRQDIASVWPQSAGVYSGLGLKVNSGSIDFRNVTYKRASEDGQPVLVVTGQIVNLASRELPVPQTIRITLTDAGNRELYHWPLKPDVQTLKAGASVAFRARLSNPPAAARFAVVSFSKDGS